MIYDPLDFLRPSDRERLHDMITAIEVMAAAGGPPEDLTFLLKIISTLILRLKHESILNSVQ